MTVLAQALDRVLGNPFSVEIPKQLLMFCGAGLAVSLVLAGYGLDLSPGFF